jgi:hypothetical protein
MLVPDVVAQLLEQLRLPFWYRLGHALFRIYLILHVHTVFVPRPSPARSAGDQTTLHNGAPLCITDRSSLLNEQLDV